MEQILQILQGIRDDIDFANEKNLIDDGILDDYDMYTIICELDRAFGIEIDIDDLEPENFNSVEGMAALVERLRRER